MQLATGSWCELLDLLSEVALDLNPSLSLTSHRARISQTLSSLLLWAIQQSPAPHSLCYGRRGSSRVQGPRDVTLPTEGLSHRDPPLSSTSSESLSLPSAQVVGSL